MNCKEAPHERAHSTARIVINANITKIVNMIHRTQNSLPDGRVERKRRSRKKTLIDQALAILEEGGWDALTLQAVADRADYAVAALYRYFPSKDALIAEMQMRVVSQIRDAVELARVRLTETPATPRARALATLAACVETYIGYAVAYPERYGLIGASLGDPRRILSDESALRVLASVEPVFSIMTGAMKDAGIPGDSRMRVWTIWATLNGILQIRKLARLSTPGGASEDLAASAVESLLAGFGVVRRDWVRARQKVASLDLPDFSTREGE